MIRYPIGQSGQTLVLSDKVLSHFRDHRQTSCWRREAGGQLFARINRDVIHVVEATGPRRSDRRSRFRYAPDAAAEQREIEQRFSLGLHFIGDWHTHPEDRPTPSPLDLRTTADGLMRSIHSLNAFVLILAGRTSFPASLHVSLHDGAEHYVLNPAAPDILAHDAQDR